jgi:hypothetical protein
MRPLRRSSDDLDMQLSTIAALHANADLLVGLLIGIAIGLVAGPVLRAWLTFVEWKESSREALLTEDLLDRLDRALDQVRGDAGSPASDDEGTWRTSR